MEESLFLVKYGEIALKKRNRGMFLRFLKDSIRAKLPELAFEVYEIWHRVFVKFDPKDRVAIAEALGRTFGIVSFCEARKVANDIGAIEEEACSIASGFIEAGLGKRFKVEVRRAEKAFPLSSYEIACRLGDTLLARYPGLVVNVHKPDWILWIEIRESTYLYGPPTRGPFGLPTGSSGTCLLLLSGGIDSPVAGWMMAKRGLAIEAVYFHAAPFTSEQARQKVETLSRVLSMWAPRAILHVVPFTPVLARIKEKANEEEVTLLLRACMMKLSSMLAEKRRIPCLVTGESLGQVASQTVESIHFTGSFAEIPVFRPLIGMNKEEIIETARRIGTFETSTLPYPDCCVLFSPPRPLIRPDVERMRKAYTRLDPDELLMEALGKTDEITL